VALAIAHYYWTRGNKETMPRFPVLHAVRTTLRSVAVLHCEPCTGNAATQLSYKQARFAATVHQRCLIHCALAFLVCKFLTALIASVTATITNATTIKQQDQHAHCWHVDVNTIVLNMTS